MTKIVGICQLIRKQKNFKIILCNQLQSGYNRLSLKDFPKNYTMQSIAFRVQLIALMDFPKFSLVQLIVIWVQLIAAEAFSKKINSLL